MKNAILVPTRPDKDEYYDPKYPTNSIWKKEFERFNITPQTVLVGHSCGGGFLVAG